MDDLRVCMSGELWLDTGQRWLMKRTRGSMSARGGGIGNGWQCHCPVHIDTRDRTPKVAFDLQMFNQWMVGKKS